jgi:hypothetical protein
MPVYTKASRARLAARLGFDDEPANPEGDDEDFTLLWRGPSSMPPPPSRSSAPPPSRRPRPSGAPPPAIDRPTPTQLAPPPPPPPPPSFPAPGRPEMRAHAAPAHAEPPRILELTVHERRWRVMVRASLLLGIGCVLGIGTEVFLQRHGAEASPDPSMTSATLALPQATPGSAAGAPFGNAFPPLAPAATQCVTTAPQIPSPAPSGPTADESATAAHALRHHHHHAPDAAQASAGSSASAPIPDGTIAPDDIAAAAEALAKAKQETMLP